MKFRLLALLFLCFSSLAFAQNKNYKNEIGFESDNDGFLGQGSDRYYTAGNFIYFNHALTVTDTNKLANRVLGFEAGQKIYTPQSGVISGPIYLDRPFAGYLYAGSSINYLYKNQSNLKLEAQIGIVGPNAYGQQIQDLIHKTFGFYTPEGWQYQIQNDFELNLSAQYNALLAHGSNIDLSFASYANLGTGQLGAGAGGMVRFGEFNPLYNSVATSSSVSANRKKGAGKEFFVYYKPLINVVGYNATIQGSMFASTPGVTELTTPIEHFLVTQQAGADLASGHWVVDASALFETRETTIMIHPGHQWGMLTAMYRFN